jgi:hypothetical protein
MRTSRHNWIGWLPLILGSGMAFLLLTGAWNASITGGLDAEIGTRYLILESKLQLLVGAVSSFLCFSITCLRLQNPLPANS